MHNIITRKLIFLHFIKDYLETLDETLNVLNIIK